MFRQVIKDYFVFSRKERRAVIFLVIIILVMAFLPAFFPQFIRTTPSLNIDSVRKEISAIPIHNDSSSPDESSMINDMYDTSSIKKKEIPKKINQHQSQPNENNMINDMYDSSLIER